MEAIHTTIFRWYQKIQRDCKKNTKELLGRQIHTRRHVGQVLNRFLWCSSRKTSEACIPQMKLLQKNFDWALNWQITETFQIRYNQIMTSLWQKKTLSDRILIVPGIFECLVPTEILFKNILIMYTYIRCSIVNSKCHGPKVAGQQDVMNLIC